MNSTRIDGTLINGIACNYLSIYDRAIHYGDGLFETVLCRKKPCSEAMLYYWQRHYQRLQTSAQKLKMDCPDERLLLDDIATLLEQMHQDENDQKASAQSYVIKVIITRGTGERGYLFPDKNDINRIVSCTPLATDYSSLLTETLLSGELTVCQQQVSINEQLAGLKHLNRLDNVMARNEWNKQGYSGHRSRNNNFIDGLMLNADGFVIEGSMSNVFAVRGDEIITPTLTRSGVRGVMRDVIIDIAKIMGLSLMVRDMTLAEIYTMDEIFISNSLIGLKSVTGLSAGNNTAGNNGNPQQRVLSRNSITQKIFDEIIRTTDTYAINL